jgi:hypothetical protein
MKVLVQVAAYWVLLVVSVVLGFLGKPSEMALSILAGTLGLIFADIDRFVRLGRAHLDAGVREKLEAILEKEIEPAALPHLHRAIAPIDDNTLRVMEALRDSRFTWRHLGGLSEETALSQQAVSASLGWLVTHDLAKESDGADGPIWSLTPRGRHVHAEMVLKS